MVDVYFALTFLSQPHHF